MGHVFAWCTGARDKPHRGAFERDACKPRLYRGNGGDVPLAAATATAAAAAAEELICQRVVRLLHALSARHQGQQRAMGGGVWSFDISVSVQAEGQVSYIIFFCL